MRAASHRTELEELMAWLDDELPAADTERVRAHVARCDECGRMESDMRQLSARMSKWTVSDTPARLRLAGRYSFFHRTRLLQVAAFLILAIGGVAMWQMGRQPTRKVAALPVSYPSMSLPASEQPAVEMEQPPMTVMVGGTGPLLVRTARLALVPPDFDAARREMERIVTTVGGFIGQISVSDARAGERSLRATLRVPAPKLDEALAALKGLGRVTSESLQGDDVTQQSVDLDARLANARASEVRLKDILETRTGRLSDVLDVEREITRVRGEIEGMEAQRKSLDGRITYAEVTVQMSEGRKAAVDLGPEPIGTRLRNALVDGWTSAITSALDAILFVARTAPVLILWMLILALPAWWARRRFAR